MNRTRTSPRPMALLRQPFTATTWRQAAYHLAALPVGVLCLPLALVGGPAGRLQRALARSLLQLAVDEPRRPDPLRALAHALLALPLNLLAAFVTFYGWLVVLLNLGYPLRPGAGPGDDLTDAWGGPTLAGAWAVHAAGGVLVLLSLPWASRGLSTLQGRLLVRFLGGRTTADRP